jgi:hypothetical protein
MSEREEYDELECDEEDGWDDDCWDEACEECGFEISECLCDDGGWYDDEMDIDYDEGDYE